MGWSVAFVGFVTTAAALILLGVVLGVRWLVIKLLDWYFRDDITMKDGS